EVTSAALQEIENRPLLRLFLTLFAKRVREQTKLPMPSQAWKERILCAFAYTILDMDGAIIGTESAELS
ncbi:unnamed protein product, partial [marine sediment metagenome]